MKYTTLALALATLAFAKTDYEGCTSSETVVFGGASLIWWDPTNGEICSFLDCGGGRAPPKTTVPGCPQYSGTASYTPDFMPGWGAASATPTPSETGKQESSTGGFLQASGSPTEGATETEKLTALPTLTAAPSGTGFSSVITSKAGGNNVTATATLTSHSTSPSAPENTGAATVVAVGKAVAGLAIGVVGLAVL